MFYPNPLEPRIPVRPPWADYAEFESNWVATPGVYVTPLWKLAASFAGGQAVSRSKVVSDTDILIDPAVVVVIDSSRVRVQVDPDAAYVINQAYNAFRTQIVSSLPDYPNPDNFEKTFEKRIPSWMLSHIKGLYELLMSYIEDEPDIDKPLVMISKFAGRQAAFDWFGQMKDWRGAKVPVPYVELSPEFIGFATKMYYIADSVNLDAVLEIIGVGTDSQPFEELFYQDRSDSPIFHGTTLSVIRQAYPDAILDREVVAALTATWETFILEQDRQMGESMQQLMKAIASQRQKPNPMGYSTIRRNPRPSYAKKYGYEHRIEELYKEGLSDRQIAETLSAELLPKVEAGKMLEVGLPSEKNIKHWRKSHKLPPNHIPTKLETLDTDIQKLYLQQLADHQIAEQLGINRSSVEKWREKYGLLANGGYATLSDTYPEVAAEWHTEKNFPLLPEHVTAGSGKKVWWRCKANPNHEWVAQINQRAVFFRPSGCPWCFYESGGRFPVEVKPKGLLPDQIAQAKKLLQTYNLESSEYNRISAEIENYLYQHPAARLSQIKKLIKEISNS